MSRQNIQWTYEELQDISFYVQQFKDRNIIASDDILNLMAEGFITFSYMSYDLNDLLADFHDSRIMISCTSLTVKENIDVNTIYVALSNCFELSDCKIVHYHIFYPKSKEQNLNILFEALKHIVSRNSECDIKYQIILSSSDDLLIRCFYKE